MRTEDVTSHENKASLPDTLFDEALDCLKYVRLKTVSATKNDWHHHCYRGLGKVDCRPKTPSLLEMPFQMRLALCEWPDFPFWYTNEKLAYGCHKELLLIAVRHFVPSKILSWSPGLIREIQPRCLIGFYTSVHQKVQSSCIAAAR